MSTNKTENLGLHSWVRSDPFKMDEFNENFDKIDKAVGENSAALENKAEQTALDAVSQVANGAARIHLDSYMGDGTCGQDHPTSITFPFTPKLVIITAETAAYYSGTAQNAYAIVFWNQTTHFVYGNNNVYNGITYDGNKMSWYTSSSTQAASQLNQNGKTYRYCAIG